MLNRVSTVFAALLLAASLCSAQSLSPKWEDLTSADFVKALQQSGGVCLLPMGSVEKFGPSGPLGTNLYLARLVSLEAAKKEYVLVFPDYFTAVTANTSNLPGTVSYSPQLILQMLQETVNEMGRNGCKKILLVNGHSPNEAMITFFMAGIDQTPHDYVVYAIYGPAFPVWPSQLAQLPKELGPSKPGVDGHGGEERISGMLAYYPDLVHLDRAHDEPIIPNHLKDQPIEQLDLAVTELRSVPTGYMGDASGATVARGKANIEFLINRMVKTIQAIKADSNTPRVQKEFLEQREHPIPAAK